MTPTELTSFWVTGITHDNRQELLKKLFDKAIEDETDSASMFRVFNKDFKYMISLEEEPENKLDSDAIHIYLNWEELGGKKLDLGYVPKQLTKTLKEYLLKDRVKSVTLSESSNKAFGKEGIYGLKLNLEFKNKPGPKKKNAVDEIITIEPEEEVLPELSKEEEELLTADKTDLQFQNLIPKELTKEELFDLTEKMSVSSLLFLGGKRFRVVLKLEPMDQ